MPSLDKYLNTAIGYTVTEGKKMAVRIPSRRAYYLLKRIYHKYLKKYEMNADLYSDHNSISNNHSSSNKTRAKENDIVLLSGIYGFPSQNYRIEHIREALLDSDYQVSVYDVYNLPRTHSILSQNPHIMILVRVAWNVKGVSELVAKAREKDIKIIFECDDLIFSPGIINFKYIDGLRFLSRQQIKDYQAGSYQYYKSMLNSDLLISSTNYLSNYATNKTGIQSRVIHNFLSKSLVSASELESNYTARIRGQKANESVLICYTPGTKTHQRDFAIAEPALRRIMEKHDVVTLVIIGELDLDEFPKLAEFKHRIYTLKLMPHKELIKVVSETDIAIAPLETDNPFCDAKSAIKYLEAGISGVPIIASNNPEFIEYINDGHNGFIARTDQEWFDRLDLLILDKSLRIEIGQNARQSCLEQHTYQSYIPYLDNLFREVTGTVYAFLLPTLTSGSGGHNKIFSLASSLSAMGNKVYVYCESLGTYKSTRLVKEDYGIDQNVQIEVGFKKAIRKYHFVFSTFWNTAYFLSEMKGQFRKIYFIQDYEPYFYPIGIDYIRAAQSYTLPLERVSYGPWCKEMIESLHSKSCSMVPFSIDKHFWSRSATTHRERTPLVIGFARPDMSRRMGALVEAALLAIKRRQPAVHCIIFGGLKRFTSPYEGNIDYVGLLSKDEMKAYFSRAWCGVALSPTNPSMVPLEMALCSLPVVDIVPVLPMVHCKPILGAGCLQVQPTANSIANAVLQIVEDISLRDHMSRKGYETVNNTVIDNNALATQLIHLLNH